MKTLFKNNSSSRKSRITLKPRLRTAMHGVYIATGAFIVIATIGLMTYFQFAKVESASATTQVISLVQSNSFDAGTVSSASLAFTSANTAGNLIVVAFRDGGGSTLTSISDTRGNTYTLATSQIMTGDASGYVYYAKNIAAGTDTIKIAISASATMRFAIQEYSGLSPTSPLDVVSSNQEPNSAAPNSGNITTSGSDELVFGFSFVSNTETFTAGSGFTQIVSLSSKLQTEQEFVNAGTYSASTTLNASDLWGCIVVAFKNYNAESISKDYFRTHATGNWNSTSTWQSSHNDTTWINATLTPDSGANTIAIQNGDTVKVTANVIADQIVDSAGTQITINDGITLTLSNGAGTDLDVYGTLEEIGTGATGASISINSGATIVFESSGIYKHDFSSASTAGTIPTATWNVNSTCEIIGYTSNTTPPSGLSQTFGNFEWNCPSQTANVNLSGNLTTIAGNFMMVSTGSSSELQLGNGGSTMTLSGNFNQTGGILDMEIHNGNKTGTINVGGNWSQTGGTITIEGNNVTSGQFTFTKAGTQTFTASGNTISGYINFTVNSGSTLNLGTNILTGNNFTLSSGGSIIIGSATGITTSGSTGNIRITGTGSYSAGANYTYSGSSAQSTGNALPSTVNNLTLNNTSGLTLTNTVTVSNILTLTSGIITTGSNQINVSNTATTAITGYSSSSYIVGNLDRSVSSSGSYDFPLGTAANYEFTNITLSSTTGFTDILGTFTNANPISALLPLASLLVNGTTITDMLNYGYWTLTPNTTITGGSYTVTIKEKGHTNPASSPSSYCVLKRHDGLSSWQSLGTTNNSTQSEVNGVATIACSGLTSFSQYGGGMGGGALPIELLSFNAQFNTNHVDLTWSTASEINNDYFTISRSQDGINYEEVLRKPGAGTSTVELNYTAIDDAPLQGISYYRLTQTDYNGHFVNFPPKAIEYGLDKNQQNITIKTAGPNPFTDNFNINYSIPQAGIVDVQISSTSGQIVYKETVNADMGFNTYSYTDMKGLPPGIYIVNMICNGQAVTEKMVKR